MIEICRSRFLLSSSCFLIKDVSHCWKPCSLKTMSQTLGRQKKSFMVGFPAELSWLRKRRGWEEGYGEWVGCLGLVVGVFRGGYGGRGGVCVGGWGGVLPFDLFRAAERERGSA